MISFFISAASHLFSTSASSALLQYNEFSQKQRRTSLHGFETSWLLKPTVWRNLIHNTELGLKKSSIPPVTEREMRTVISKQRNQRSLCFWPQTQQPHALKDTANSEFTLLNSEKVPAFSLLHASSKWSKLHIRTYCTQVRWGSLQAQDRAPQISGCFECTGSHAPQANSCLSCKSFQTICTVRMDLKCACSNHEECSRRKASRVWFTKRKKHIF